jgi:hypothetical protein
MLVLAAALWGFALSVKINAIFLPVIVLAWLWLTRNLRRESLGGAPNPSAPDLPTRSDRVRDVRLVLLLLAVAAASFYLSWPYLWVHPTEFLRHVEFVFLRGQTGKFEFDFAPLVDWLTTTPEVVLVGSLVGIVFACLERDGTRRSFLLLVILWYVVPLVRANLPGMRHYDGIRHFLEITVPAAILASYGWLRIIEVLATLAVRLLHAAWPHVAIKTVLVLGLLGVAAWSFRGLHPYELAYFNRASGGLSAARERGHPDAGDYWAASYRQGVRWMNANLPPESLVAVPFGEHLVALTRGSPDGLRRDIHLVNVTGPFTKEAGDVITEKYDVALVLGPVYVMYVPRESWKNNVIRHAEWYGTPIFPGGEVGGVRVLNIFRVPQRTSEGGEL